MLIAVLPALDRTQALHHSYSHDFHPRTTIGDLCLKVWLFMGRDNAPTLRLIIRGRFTKGFNEIKLAAGKRDHSGEELFTTELQLKCIWLPTGLGHTSLVNLLISQVLYHFIDCQ